MLTSAQNALVKADILADVTLNAFPHNSDGAFSIALGYTTVVVPDFWVWRSAVPAKEIYETTTADGTVWSWTTYIARSQGERDGWRDLFSGSGVANPSLANMRQAIADIFSGPLGAAQRTHLLTISRRKATRIEKLLATGVGTTVSPATLGFEGPVIYQDILTARES